MGYTHYWTLKSEPTREKFLKAVGKISTILTKNNLASPFIAGWDGTGEPTFCGERIVFNGRADKREDYETFRVERARPEWAFCKTARMPYDVVVCITLLVLRKVLGAKTFTFSSDGTYYGDVANMDEGWAKAYELTGYKPPKNCFKDE